MPRAFRDSSGTIWLVYFSNPYVTSIVWSPGWSIQYLKSDNGGETWSGPYTICTFEGTADGVAMTKDSTGRIWIVWSTPKSPSGGNNEVWYSISNDGGNTWTSPATPYVPPAPWNGYTHPSIIEASGKMWIFFRHWMGGNREGILYFSSDDGGLTWSSRTVIVDGPESEDVPYPYLDSVGNLWLVWSRDYSWAGPRDIWYISTGDGLTWSAETHITNSPDINENYPSIVEDTFGNMFVFFERYEGDQFDIWYCESDSRGNKWTNPLQITEDPGEDRFPTGALVGNSIYVFWESNRAGSSDIWYVKNVLISPGRADVVYVSSEWGPPPGWNPLLPNTRYSMAKIMYPTLYLYTPYSDEWIPYVAESHQWIDKYTLKVKIRDEAKWSDGQPLTAQDFKYTLELGKKYEIGDLTPPWDHIQEIRAIDNKNVWIVTNEKKLNYFQMLSMLCNAYILPKHRWEVLEADLGEKITTEFRDDDPEKIVGAGPYKLLTWSEEVCYYERVDDWWGRYLFGLPTPKYVAHRTFKDNEAATLAFEAAEVDVMTHFVPKIWEIWEVKKLARRTYYTHPPYYVGGGVTFLWINYNKKPLDNVVLRRAIAHLIPFNELISEAYFNYSVRAATVPIIHTSPAARFINQTLVERYKFEYDLAKAKKILDDAGITDKNGDGWREMPDGTKLGPFIIQVPYGWTDWMMMCNIIATNLKQAGIECDTNFPSFSVWWTRLSDKDWDLVIGWADAAPGVAHPWNAFRSTMDPRLSHPAGNWENYKNTTVEALVDAVPKESDPQNLMAIYSQLEEMWLRDLPGVPLFYGSPVWYEYSEEYWVGWPAEENSWWFANFWSWPSNMPVFFAIAPKGQTPSQRSWVTNLKIPTSNWLMTTEKYPDLGISNVSWEPSDPVVGDSVTFCYTIRNQGDKNTTDFTNALYIDGERIDISSRMPLAAGTSQIRSFTYGWTATEGPHTIEVVGDDLNEIVESNETNNKIGKTLTLRPANDLHILSIEPVQVIWGASALVADKLTLVKVEIGSTFQDSETTQIRLTFDGETYTENIEISGRSSTILYLPSSAPILPKKTGTIAISVKIDPNNNISESNETNNVKPVSATVKDTKGLKLLYVPVGYLWDTPIDAEKMLIMSEESSTFIKAAYPIADDELVYKINTIRFVPPIPPVPVLEIEYIILQLSEMAWVGDYDRVVGITLTGWLDPHTPLIEGDVGLSLDSMPGVLVDNGFWSTPAHEIAHIYGIVFKPEEYDSNWPGNEADGYWVHKREQVLHGFCFMGTPISQSFVLMPLNRHVWVDNTHYEYLLKKFESDPDPEVLGISGFIYRNGTVVLRPWYRLPYGVPDLMPGTHGNYSIVFLDSSGQVLSQIGFNVTFPDGYDATVFAFRIPYAPNTSQIQIQNERGQNLTSREVSAISPLVILTFPRGGEFLGPRNYTITWEADDQDGDRLTYTVLYSADGGENWIPLVSGLNETKYVLDISKFPEGTSYLIKIVASDGTNTGQDVSRNTFTTDFSSPNVAIKNPLNASYVISFITDVNFIVEDDHLAHVLLKIDDDFLNVTGKESYRFPFMLFGSHKVEIIAVDSAGNESSSVVYVTSLDWLIILLPAVFLVILFIKLYRQKALLRRTELVK